MPITSAAWDFGAPGCSGFDQTETCTPVPPFLDCVNQAFKFAQALKQRDPGCLPDDFLAGVLDLVALGLVAVGCTYFVLTGSLSVSAVLGGAILGCLATAVLAVNNLRDSAMELIPFQESEAVCVMPRGHPLEVHDVVTPDLLDGQNFIAILRRHIVRSRLDRLFLESGVTPNRIAEVATGLSAAALARAVAALAPEAVAAAHTAAVDRWGPVKRPTMRIDFDAYLGEIEAEIRRGQRRAARGAQTFSPEAGYAAAVAS